jgi:hypothetical protein
MREGGEVVGGTVAAIAHLGVFLLLLLPLLLGFGIQLR